VPREELTALAAHVPSAATEILRQAPVLASTDLYPPQVSLIKLTVARGRQYELLGQPGG
jgi:hypothetical protein